MTEGTPPDFTNIEIQKIVDSVKDTTRQEESNPKPKENIGAKVRRMFAAGAAVVTFAAGTAGCAEVQKTPTTITEVQPSETTPSVTVTPTETTVKVTPTETPTPTPEIIKDPKIAGTKVVKNEEGTFLVEVNENGEVKEGEYVGEFRDNVFVDGEKVEAWALTPSKAEKLLEDELAKIPRGELKIKVILPIDALQSKGNINISEEKDDMGNTMLKLKSDEAFDVLNVIPNYDDLYMYWYPYEGKTYGVPIYVGQDLGENLNTMTDENAMYFLQVTYEASETMNEDTTSLKSHFGGIIGNSNGSDVYVGCGDESGTYSINKDSIVKTEDGSYVFMTSKIEK